MRARYLLLLGFGPAIAAAACAYPEFEYECRFGTDEGCAYGLRCALLDATSMSFGCVEAGPKQAWQRCSSDADCATGTLCDLRYLACKPVCSSATDCRFTVNDGAASYEVQGECIDALGGNGKPLGSGLKHCTASCEPKSASPCDKGSNVKCFLRQNLGFDCGLGGLSGLGQGCGDALDCGVGLVCVKVNGAGVCAAWCDNVNGTCQGTNGVCVGFSSPLSYTKGASGNVQYGACAP
ncbi:MAG: hypothetical protein FJ095_12475 [Deltaproteobacteria bacterium]|nr:hypothetical protein [Deltaproteobacteria bacterium]